MSQQRRKFTAEFKARVVIEMLTEQKSAAQASREYGIKDSVLSRWKQEFIERSPMLFEQGNGGPDDRDQRIAELERMVGRLALEAHVLARFDLGESDGELIEMFQYMGLGYAQYQYLEDATYYILSPSEEISTAVLEAVLAD